jgi:hypothetical protein
MLEITGLKQLIKKIEGAKPYLDKKIPFILQEYGNKMIIEARANHTFTSRSGQLERAITCKVTPKSWTMVFYIDGTRLMSAKYNYGWIQHDGSGKGYKQSRFSVAVTPKLQKGGITADHFMVRAFDKFDAGLKSALETEIRKVFQ